MTAPQAELLRRELKKKYGVERVMPFERYLLRIGVDLREDMRIESVYAASDNKKLTITLVSDEYMGHTLKVRIRHEALSLKGAARINVGSKVCYHYRGAMAIDEMVQDGVLRADAGGWIAI